MTLNFDEHENLVSIILAEEGIFPRVSTLFLKD
jgi:hypothetical protein